MCCKLYVQILCFWFIEFRVVVSFKIRIGTSSIVYKLGLAKDYYIDGQNTQLIFFEKNTTGGGKKAPQITSRGWIFWTTIFYNIKKFTSRSI